jgi:hypothetical protein
VVVNADKVHGTLAPYPHYGPQACLVKEFDEGGLPVYALEAIQSASAASTPDDKHTSAKVDPDLFPEAYGKPMPAKDPSATDTKLLSQTRRLATRPSRTGGHPPSSRPRGISPIRQPGDDLRQCLRLHRLDQVQIEAGLQGLVPCSR